MPHKILDFPTHFWNKVNTKQSHECWLWVGGTYHRQGYGEIWIAGRNTQLAHRIAYELTYGSIPKDLKVLHKCDNPPCVNPSHLFLGTQADNVRDCISKGRAVFPSPGLGTLNANAVLTQTDVNQIRDKYKTGQYLQKELAREYGMSRQHISAIILGTVWKNAS